MCCLFAINRANLPFKTTIIEESHLTLTGIPFNFYISNIREKIFRVSVPVHIYNSLLYENIVIFICEELDYQTYNN